MTILIAIDREYAGFHVVRTEQTFRLVLGFIAITFAFFTEVTFHNAIHNIVMKHEEEIIFDQALLTKAINYVDEARPYDDVDSLVVNFNRKTQKYSLLIGEYEYDRLEAYYGSKETEEFSSLYHDLHSLAFDDPYTAYPPQSEDDIIAEAIAHDIEVAERHGYKVVPPGCWHVPPCEDTCKGDVT